MKIFLFCAIFFLVAFVNAAQSGTEKECTEATAVLTSKDGTVSGTIRVKKTGTEDCGVHITGTIYMPESEYKKRGFHIHEKGAKGDNCLAAGGHYNPEGKQHGSPDVSNRHKGDLGNVEQNGKTITIDIHDSQACLTGPYSVLDRSFVLHDGIDDLGRNNDEGSKTTGNAGGRIACGPIIKAF